MEEPQFFSFFGGQILLRDGEGQNATQAEGGDLCLLKLHVKLCLVAWFVWFVIVVDPWQRAQEV